MPLLKNTTKFNRDAIILQKSIKQKCAKYKKKQIIQELKTTHKTIETCIIAKPSQMQWEQSRVESAKRSDS